MSRLAVLTLIPNPDPPEAEKKLPQRHQDTKRNVELFD